MNPLQEAIQRMKAGTDGEMQFFYFDLPYNSVKGILTPPDTEDEEILSQHDRRVQKRQNQAQKQAFIRHYQSKSAAEVSAFLDEQIDTFLLHESDKREEWLTAIESILDYTPPYASDADGSGKLSAVKKWFADQRSTPETKVEPELTHAQIALLRYYNNLPITEGNAEEIAKQYGQTSGRKLYQTYGKILKDTQERIGKQTSVENIKKILPYLSELALNRAKEELRDAEKYKDKHLINK